MSDHPSLPAEAAALVRDFAGDEWTVEPLAGDASVRAYFRIVRPDGRTYMLAYYPAEVRPQLLRFLSAYAAVAPHGRIPEVLRHSEQSVLQADVGSQTLFDLLHGNREAALPRYRQAIDLLVAFQRAPAGEINPPFTADFFASELEMTLEFYVEQLMGEGGIRARLAPVFRTIAETIAQHPYVLCHRDYHGQNLHLFDDTLYMIDYQDLRMGPDTYDLASLLRDRGAAFIIGEDAELDLLAYYEEQSGAVPGIRRRYFETLLQRSVKVLGTFAKQPIVRGRLHYLDYIPAALASIRRCAGELPQLATITELLPMNFALEETRARLRKEQDGKT